jgi:hypothetical protein
MSLGPAPHPAVRLLALIALGVFLFRYQVVALAVVFLLLAALIARGGSEALAGLGRALRRIRWLLVSIVVIYLWVAPEPSGTGSWAIPGWADIDLALRRAGVLVVLVAAVELLRQTTPAPRTAAAIAQILRPLTLVGLNVRRFAARVALTLEAVPATAEIVGRAAGETTIKKGQLRGWAETAAALILEIEQEAPSGPGDASLPELGPPALSDWCLLAGVVALLYALTLLPT